MNTKDRESRSKLRLKLSTELRTWRQREQDICLEVRMEKPGAAERLVFCRQEMTKSEKKLRDLDAGVRLQRVWASGRSSV